MEDPREDWPRLGSYVVSARKGAGFGTRRAFAVAIGVTDRTLGKLEVGERVGADTLAAVADGVGWTPDSPRRILAGGEPVAPGSRHGQLRPAPPPLTEEGEPGDAASGMFPDDETLQAIWRLHEPVEVRESLVATIRALRRESQGNRRSEAG
jgi:hypothetical protein